MRLHHIKKIYQVLKHIFGIAYRAFQLVWSARSTGHSKSLLKGLWIQLRACLHHFEIFLANSKEFGDLNAPTLQTLKNKVRGLHSLLPNSERFQYSILIPVYKPNPIFFEKALKSAFDQSAPHCEILLGLDGPQSNEVLAVIEKFKKLQAPHLPKVRSIQIDRDKTGGGISRTTNELAKAASGNYLLLMDHDDWILPDLLFRYEQCLRLLKDPENFVLYCNEYKINEKDEPIPGSDTSKREHPIFPYIFVNYICHCLLVPRKLWEKVGGLRPECDGAQDFDLCLRLDIAQAQFQLIPFFLYAWRAHSQSTAQSADQKDYATDAGIRALTDYVAAKKLDWKIEKGYLSTTYRAIPKAPVNPRIQVIIPYKDQKELTVKAVRSILAQKGLKLWITAVDNRSQDLSIAQELEQLGVEVIKVDEPFNYSRLNNIAVKNSRYANQAEYLLFLNNDVELEPEAVLEMTRWVDQPRVGLVGTRLHYPSGTLQHGGVVIDLNAPARGMSWFHVDYHFQPFALGFSKVISICDAVTAASLLIRRDVFLKVGGFDEIWYPIAFSDTDLAMKVRRLGLYPLYTPYAAGTHYESASRGPGVHELPDASYWLFRSTTHRDVPQESLKHHVFL